MPIYLEPADAARLIRCSSQNVCRLCDEGRLRVAARTVRGGRLLDLADVQAYATARERGRQ